MEKFNTTLFLLLKKDIRFDSRTLWDFAVSSLDLSKRDVAGAFSKIPFVVTDVYVGDEILEQLAGNTRTVKAGETIYLDVTFEDGSSLSKKRELHAEKYYQGNDKWVIREDFDIVDMERIFRTNCLVNTATVRFFVLRNGYVYGLI